MKLKEQHLSQLDEELCVGATFEGLDIETSMIVSRLWLRFLDRATRQIAVGATLADESPVPNDTPPAPTEADLVASYFAYVAANPPVPNDTPPPPADVAPESTDGWEVEAADLSAPSSDLYSIYPQDPTTFGWCEEDLGYIPPAAPAPDPFEIVEEPLVTPKGVVGGVGRTGHKARMMANLDQLPAAGLVSMQYDDFNTEEE